MKSSEIYCREHGVVATINVFGGIEIYGFEEDDMETYVYVKSGANFSSGLWSYHRFKVYYGVCGEAYFKYNGTRIQLADCLRRGV